MSRKEKKQTIVETNQTSKRPVIFLVADNNMEATVQGFLSNPNVAKHLRVSPFEFDPQEDIVVESGHDPGVYQRAP